MVEIDILILLTPIIAMLLIVPSYLYGKEAGVREVIKDIRQVFIGKPNAEYEFEEFIKKLINIRKARRG